MNIKPVALEGTSFRESFIAYITLELRLFTTFVLKMKG